MVIYQTPNWLFTLESNLDSVAYEQGSMQGKMLKNIQSQNLNISKQDARAQALINRKLAEAW